MKTVLEGTQEDESVVSRRPLMTRALKVFCRIMKKQIKGPTLHFTLNWCSLLNMTHMLALDCDTVRFKGCDNDCKRQ